MNNRQKIYSNEIYHVFNRSIAGFQIFKDSNNSKRFLYTLSYYNRRIVPYSLSLAIRKHKFVYKSILQRDSDSITKIISYCLMPDHYHLLIKIINHSSFYKYINNIENSFTRFFNKKFNRKGPLWQGPYKSIRIKTNEQLLHVSRYINLNPTTSSLVKKPEEWIFSSYRDLIYNKNIFNDIKEISISDNYQYKKFVEDNIDYQKNLKKIKKLIIE